MNGIELIHSGWGKGSVRVTHAPAGLATVLEFRGGLLSALQVNGLTDTPDRLERGRELINYCWGNGSARALVPKEYTHVATGKPGGLSPRWKLGFGTGDSLAELSATASGRFPDALRYTGPPARVRLEVEKAHATVAHSSISGEHRSQLHVSSSPFRGTLALPGPGIIEVACLAKWSLTVL
ncbi:hypothetical protein ACFWPV_00970 [Streptomyces uncialis]|uniref:hypothetical protein n=1 Tax=Streptomyces uncialis TaxID=1048205 RepID=UPI003661384A